MPKYPKIIPTSEIFLNVNYVVPIYQRNYAWGVTQIEQLIEDIDSSIDKKFNNSYFLGNLIVNQTDNNVYEVIDGQQRITTLFLLEKYLKIPFANEALRFEAREKSNRTLSYIGNDNNSEYIDEISSQELFDGYQIIENYFKNKNINKNSIKKKLKQVFIIRVQVPKNIDLNHYFEIMNTRGEQLELHEIVKAKLLYILESDDEKNIAAKIWDKCSDMNSYIQMNFNVSDRKEIFTDNWSSLKKSVNDFDSLKSKLSKEKRESAQKTLKEFLKGDKILNKTDIDQVEENERFESTISFPNFLLQVNVVIKKTKEELISLDDKYFLDNLSWTWATTKDAKKFLFCLLKCRVLFDKYVLKREFARDYKEIGKWSLQRLEQHKDNINNSYKPKYISTLNEDGEENKKLRTLQSSLRITYTSPKTMYWISKVLLTVLEDEATDIIPVLEEYCKKKIIDSEFKNKSGFQFERIVFSYLDYLIYRDGYFYKNEKIISPLEEKWQFQFRSSIEHFFPQNPAEEDSWEQEELDNFGNLALITVSGNSKFSNLPPTGKINSYPSIIEQSLKLKIMSKMINIDDNGWNKKKMEIHKEEMFKILEKN